MCRHLAYVGPEVSLKSLLIDPPYGLYRQAWAPRMQRHGTVNADGFGIGWYASGDPVPARYRRAVPIWGDPSLPDLARVTRSSAVLAAVRDATVGTALGEAAAAPFAVVSISTVAGVAPSSIVVPVCDTAPPEVRIVTPEPISSAAALRLIAPSAWHALWAMRHPSQGSVRSPAPGGRCSRGPGARGCPGQGSAELIAQRRRRRP